MLGCKQVMTMRHGLSVNSPSWCWAVEDEGNDHHRAVRGRRGRAEDREEVEEGEAGHHGPREPGRVVGSRWRRRAPEGSNRSPRARHDRGEGCEDGTRQADGQDEHHG
jgi:hypothetical protein